MGTKGHNICKDGLFPSFYFSLTCSAHLYIRTRRRNNNIFYRICTLLSRINTFKGIVVWGGIHMTLAELRKKYVGKRVDESYANQHSISIDADTGDYEYFAEVTIDDDRKITHISRMTGRRLVGDDATRVNYENIRISADDYDLIDYDIESLLDPDEVVKDKTRATEYVPPKTDEEELRQEVYYLGVLERVALTTGRYINTDYNRQRIKELMQKIAENEHRYFKIVNEYSPERSRHELTIKEITPDKKERQK